MNAALVGVRAVYFFAAPQLFGWGTVTGGAPAFPASYRALSATAELLPFLPVSTS